MKRSNKRSVFSPLLSMAIAVVVGGSFITAPQPAQAVVCATCATEWTQILNNIQLVTQYQKQVQQYATQIQELQTAVNQYQNMLKNTLSLPSEIHRAATQDLQKLADLYRDSKALAYSMSNLDAQFKQSYKPFGDYAGGKVDYAAKYRQWAEQGSDNARYALKAAGLQASMFQSEDQLLSAMVARSTSAEGQKQALQAGNEIAAAQVQQIQKLRELVAAQMQMQANAAAIASDRQAVGDSAWERFNGGELQRSSGKAR